MLNLNTFLTTLYVLVDDVIKSQSPRPAHAGRRPSLTESEVVTLVITAQWKRFPSERAFARYATTQLRAFFPRMPDRAQLDRRMRATHAAVVTTFRALVVQLASADQPYRFSRESARLQ